VRDNARSATLQQSAGTFENVHIPAVISQHQSGGKSAYGSTHDNGSGANFRHKRLSSLKAFAFAALSTRIVLEKASFLKNSMLLPEMARY
jgi:hypothetical protein